MPTPFPFVANSVLTAAQLNSISELPTRTLTGSGVAVAADSYSRVILNGTSITYTINTSTFSAGQVVELYNANSTAATIAAGAGVTLNGAAGLTLAQYQTAELYAISATSFVLWKSDSGSGVVQVKSTAKTDTFTMSSTTFADITGLSVSITPISSSNLVLILAAVNLVGLAGTVTAQLRLMRDTTAIGVGDAAGSRTQATAGMVGLDAASLLPGAAIFLDTPASTSALTYKVQMRGDTANAIYVNRTRDDSNTANYVRTISTITALEVRP